MTEARKANPLVRWVVQLVLPVGLASGLLVGVVALGQRMRGRVPEGPEIPFVDLDCDPPVGLSREQFLEEAQYLAGLPDRLAVDRETMGRVHQAFAGHPLVAQVRQVRVLAGGRVRVDLVYRVPVLAIARPAREVDAEGVLLPLMPGRKGLPILTTKVTPPTGKPGQVWSDVRVVATAQVVALLQPHLERLGMAGCNVEIEEGEIVFQSPRARLRWGRPPGHEKVEEASAETKVSRLPDAGKLAGHEWDVRPKAGAKSRPLAAPPGERGA